MDLNRISRRNTTHLHHNIHRALRSWVAAGWCWCALFFCYRVKIQRNPRFRVFLHVVVNTERSPGYDIIYDIIIILLGGAKRVEIPANDELHPAELVWKQWHHHYDIITKHKSPWQQIDWSFACNHPTAYIHAILPLIMLMSCNIWGWLLHDWYYTITQLIQMYDPKGGKDNTGYSGNSGNSHCSGNSGYSGNSYCSGNSY